MKRQSADHASTHPDHQDLLKRCRDQATKLRRLRAAVDRSATECETYHVPERTPELEDQPG